MLSKTQAKQLASEALVFIAADVAMTSDLLAASGLQAADLRGAAARPEFGIFLLDFILQDDRRVMDFAQMRSIAPESVLQAREILSCKDASAGDASRDYG